MRSDIITVGNDEGLIGHALETVQDYIYGAGLDGKGAIHMNLLAEEVLCMVRAMVGEFSARFWIEDEGGEYRIHVDASGRCRPQQKERADECLEYREECGEQRPYGKDRRIFLRVYVKL